MNRGVTIAGVRQYKIIDKPIPEGKDGRIVIKVHKGGICGSDVHMYWEQGNRAVKDLYEGHELSGEVVDAGNSTKFKKGDRVTAIDISICYQCEYCKSGRYQLCNHLMDDVPGVSVDGGFGEYICVREDMVRKLPDNVSYVQGAMTEPLSVSYHGCKTADIKPGDRVLITGGGPIGVFATVGASVLGADTVAVTEVNPRRIEQLNQSKYITNVVDGRADDLDAQLKALAPEGFDAVIECSGNHVAAKAGIDHLKKGCPCVLLAFPDRIDADYFQFINYENSIRGSVMFTLDEFDEVIKLMGEGKIDTEDYATLIPLEGVQEAFEKISDGTATGIKYMIDHDV